MAHLVLPHWVDGKPSLASANQVGDIFNPATGQKIAEVAFADAGQVNAAVESARIASLAWSQVPVTRRSQVFYRFRSLLADHARELAQIISREHGKTVDDAAGEIARGLEVVEFACGIPQLLKGELSPNVSTGVDLTTVREPLGVVAGITPFNFPAMVGLWMYPVAIACGNAFILKPSERDPSVANRIAELFSEAGLPEGVFNVVHGDRVAVECLLEHPDVKAVSFVGSTPIARHVYQTGTQHGKRVQALGGAKNHMVILPDADLDQVTDALMGAGYGSAGERCMAISVAVPVGEKTADALMERLVPRVKDLRVGSGMEPGMEMGPLITREQRDRVASLVQSGVDQGAELLVDGRDLVVSGCENGFFIGGCLFDRVRTDMEIYKQEIFGPVLATVRVENYEDAIALIEGNEYANGVAIFTRDGDAARDFVNRIQVGMVGVNVPIPVPVAYHSFGGWKRSLFGDYHIYGTESVNFYTRLKAVTTRWPAGIKEGAVFNFPILT